MLAVIPYLSISSKGCPDHQAVIHPTNSIGRTVSTTTSATAEPCLLLSDALSSHNAFVTGSLDYYCSSIGLIVCSLSPLHKCLPAAGHMQPEELPTSNAL